MNATTVRTVRTLIITVLVMVDPALTAPAGAETRQLSLLDFLGATSACPAVNAAALELEAARREATAAGYTGDLSFGVSPLWKSAWPQSGTSTAYHEIGASIDARVPLGLSTSDAQRLAQALDRVRTAESLLAGTHLEAASTIVSTYAEFRKRYEERAVLAAEKEAAYKVLEAEEARLRSGEISLLEVLRFRRDLDNAERALARGEVELDLAYIELLLESGALEREQLGGLDEAPRPDDPLEALATLDVPPPDAALSALGDDHPRIAPARTALDAALRDVEPARDPLLSSVRLAASLADGHSGSISASIPSPSLSFSYRPPSLTFPAGAHSRSDGAREHSITVSAVFSLDAGAGRTYAAETARTEADVRAARLATAYRSVESSIVSAHRRIEAAEANIHVAARAVERAEISHNGIRMRADLGAAAPGDLETSEAALARARFEHSVAQIELLEARMHYITVAHLPEALPRDLLETIFGGTR